MSNESNENVIRQELTDEWRERGAQEGRQFAHLTNLLHEGTFDVTTDQHKSLKQLKARENLRDSMTTLELLLTGLSEETARTFHQDRDSQGFGELARDAGEAGEVGGAARQDIERRLGRSVVSPENYMTLRTQGGLWEPLNAGEADQLSDPTKPNTN